jgi:glycine cleavage system H protein
MNEYIVPDDRRYHPDHLWARQDTDGSWIVGVTDFAQTQLGEVIFVDLPTVGAHFAQGQSCAAIESAKVVSDASIPLSGTVTAINEALAETPELLNSDPYGSGWLLRMAADSPDETTLDADAYRKLIQG